MTFETPTTPWHEWPLDLKLGALREPVDVFNIGQDRKVIGSVDVHTDAASGRSVWILAKGDEYPEMRLELRTKPDDLNTLPGWQVTDKGRHWVHLFAVSSPWRGWPELRVSVDLVRGLFERSVPGSFRELAENQARSEYMTATSVPEDLDPEDAEVVAFMDGCKARARGEVAAIDITSSKGEVLAVCPHATPEGDEEARRLALAWHAGLFGGQAAGEWALMKIREQAHKDLDEAERQDAEGGAS